MAGDTGTTIVVAQTTAGSDGSEQTVITVETKDEHAQEATVAVGDKNGETTYASTEHAVKEKVFPPFDSSTFGPQLFWLALTFGALYLLMSRVALPRIGEIWEVRRDRIEGDLAEAERLRQKTDQAIETYESELAEARAKSHDIAEETRSSIKDELDVKRGEVEAELAKKIAIAEARIQQTKENALANVDEIAADTVVALVSKLTGKITPKAARDAVAGIVKG